MRWRVGLDLAAPAHAPDEYKEAFSSFSAMQFLDGREPRDQTARLLVGQFDGTTRHRWSPEGQRNPGSSGGGEIRATAYACAAAG